ncbi:MAG: hypothetical protein PHI58_00990 [Candidatus Omnitrophica bacterium]|nr:hypothetical protein [Candidatus Omnitrophota bacterium]
MTGKLKTIIVLLLLCAGVFLLYKAVFIRTVYYEIGGIKIPSKYNVLTGTVKPISNYHGKSNLRTVETNKSNKMGLTEEEVVIAKLRWAIFEQWVKARPQYKGWQKSPAIFKKANDDFRKELETSGKIIKVAK